jgi:hypothetical protein
MPLSGVTVQVTAVGSPGPTADCPTVAGNVFVDFTFRNLAGSATSSVTAVWFDDRCGDPQGSGAPLMTLCQIIEDHSPGHDVDFSPPASPSDPPGGNQLCPAFITTSGFSADADPGAANALNPGEFLTLRFKLQTGKVLDDVLACLHEADPGADPCVPGLRIALSGGGTSLVDPNAFSSSDCNCDDIPDECDVNCSAANGLCGVFPGCGAAVDSDGDAVMDDCDNCPAKRNPGQRDTDGDGKGDLCDPETAPETSERSISPSPSTHAGPPNASCEPQACGACPAPMLAMSILGITAVRGRTYRRRRSG